MHWSVVSGIRPCVYIRRVNRDRPASLPLPRAPTRREQALMRCVLCVGWRGVLTSKCHQHPSPPPPPSSTPTSPLKASTIPSNSPAVISGRSLKLTIVRLPVAPLRTI